MYAQQNKRYNVNVRPKEETRISKYISLLLRHHPEKENLVMGRSFISTGASTYSITGGQNTNLVHAFWAGVNCPTQTLALTPNLYNSLTMEQIETVMMQSAKASNNRCSFF